MRTFILRKAFLLSVICLNISSAQALNIYVPNEATLSEAIVTINASTDTNNNIYINNSILVSEILSQITMNVDITSTSKRVKHTIDLQSNDNTFYFDASGTSESISNIKIINGNSATDGGAIKFTNSGQSAVNNVDLEGHYTSQRGGAIFNNRSNISIENSTFKDNSAGINGGAITSNGNTYINNSNFISNTSNLGGAITNLNTGDLTAQNSVFYQNKATNGSGGAILNYSRTNSAGTIEFIGNIDINSCTNFEANEGTQNGGAISNSSGMLMDVLRNQQ